MKKYMNSMEDNLKSFEPTTDTHRHTPTAEAQNFAVKLKNTCKSFPKIWALKDGG